MGARVRGPLAAVVVILTACTSVPPVTPTPVPHTTATSAPSPTPSPTAGATPEAPFDGPELARRVEPAALAAHLGALQRIADENGGTRASGTAGFDATVEYVARVLEDAGYTVDRLPFTIGEVDSTSLVVEIAGAGDGVLMLGSHLDSVPAGPGINDDGSGVAALLVLATELHGRAPAVRTLRFAFWGAEEGGPFGSAGYVAGLSPEQRAEIVAYLNFDMLGSPNAVPFVYDEDGAAAGSSDVTSFFGSVADRLGIAWEPIDLEGDSDHGPFARAGIPTGGLFSGGIEPVTDAQAARTGAVAGEPADPCSHRACDTIDNVDLDTLTSLTRLIATVLIELAERG